MAWPWALVAPAGSAPNELKTRMTHSNHPTNASVIVFFTGFTLEVEPTRRMGSRQSLSWRRTGSVRRVSNWAELMPVIDREHFAQFRWLGHNNMTTDFTAKRQRDQASF